MRKINDRLTVYTHDELHKIVSDLIGEDAFKYFTYANGYDNDEEPRILFAQYFPAKQETMIVYKITSSYLRRRDLSKYTFMKAKTTGEKSIRNRCFGKDNYGDEFIEEAEKFMKFKGNEAFAYVSENIIKDDRLTLAFIACNPDKFKPDDLSIIPQYYIYMLEHLFDN